MADDDNTAQIDTEAVETEEKPVEDQFYEDRNKEDKPDADKPVEGKEDTQDADSEADSDEEETNVVDDGESDEGNQDDTKDDNADPEGSIEIKLGEDSLLAKGDVQRLEEYAKENKLSPEKANDVLGLVEKGVAEHVERFDAGAEERNNKLVDEAASGWLKATKADKEIGGENLKQTAAYANRVISQYGTPELKTALNDSGLGNHPELVRMLARIGKAGADDIVSNDNLPPESKPVSDGDLFYGDT